MGWTEIGWVEIGCTPVVDEVVDVVVVELEVFQVGGNIKAVF